MQILFVNEVFVSLQGEGHFTGTPAIFVRLQGCDVHCPWCDTGYAMSLARDLHTKDNDFSVLAKETASGLYTSMDPEILCNYLSGLHKSIRHVVLTGGEPFMQDVAPFIRLLQGRGFYVQVETSGTRPLSVYNEENLWITLSPKRARMPLAENWSRANEIKIPIASEEDADFLLSEVFECVARKSAQSPIIALQPVSQDREATRLCFELCLKHNLHLSLQTHKYTDFR